MDIKTEQFNEQPEKIRQAISIILGLADKDVVSENSVTLNRVEMQDLIKLFKKLGIKTLPVLLSNYHTFGRHGPYHIFVRTGPRWYTSNAFYSKTYKINPASSFSECFEQLARHVHSDYPNDSYSRGEVRIYIPKLEREISLKCSKRSDNITLHDYEISYDGRSHYRIEP